MRLCNLKNKKNKKESCKNTLLSQVWSFMNWEEKKGQVWVPLFHGNKIKKQDIATTTTAIQESKNSSNNSNKNDSWNTRFWGKKLGRQKKKEKRRSKLNASKSNYWLWITSVLFYWRLLPVFFQMVALFFTLVYLFLSLSLSLSLSKHICLCVCVSLCLWGLCEWLICTLQYSMDHQVWGRRTHTHTHTHKHTQKKKKKKKKKKKLWLNLVAVELLVGGPDEEEDEGEDEQQ